MKEDLLNEIKDYTDKQLLGGLALSVMHRIYCKDMLNEARSEYLKYKEVPEFCPQCVIDDHNKWMCALEHAIDIEHLYKDMLIERDIIKMSSEVDNQD